jgi:hypothetical protein
VCPERRGAIEEASRLRGIGEALHARPASGLSPDAYDLLRIGAWALVILGAATMVLGIVRAARQQP